MDIHRDENLDLDWKECLEWIKRCGFLKSKYSNLNIKNSSLYLLFEMIDGILPLNILKRLSNYKIDPFKYREYTDHPNESEFHCVKNLKLFNKLAHEYFDINETELVDAVKLYRGREFGKFILLLSKISKSKCAASTGISGFPSQSHDINAEHEYYIFLGDLVVTSDMGMRRTYEDDNDHEEEAEGHVSNEKKIYESLVEHKYNEQSAELTVTKSPRELCILEIVESEKNYVDSLQILVKGYKGPMSSHLTYQELDTIFKYIEELYSIHIDFYRQISSVLSLKSVPPLVVGQPKKLHDAFIDCKPSMLIYGKYCANIQIARNLIQDIIKTNAVKRGHLERCQEFTDKFKMFSLVDLLTLPMQRVLKYHLLLAVLVKCTEESDEDLEGLKRAHEAMVDLAHFVNDVKRDQEAIISIDKIQSEMVQIHLPDGKKLSDYGRRQKDGELKVQLETDVKPRLRHVFIFDKMILLAKRKNDTYDFKFAFYLQDKAPEETNVQPRRPEKVFPFKINVGLTKRDFKSIIVFTKCEEMRTQWINAVNAAIHNQYPPGCKSNGYSFQMTTFSNYEICHFCNKLLSGAFYQGYFCKNSRTVSHKWCIPSHDTPRNESSYNFGNQKLCPLFSPSLPDPGDINESGVFFNENSVPRTNGRGPQEPLRDHFNMVPFVDISQRNQKVKPRQKIESYENEPWYVGAMEREEANSLLQHSCVGTFLIRISNNLRRQGEYSLSVKDNEPRHMKIQRNIVDNTFYLEDLNKFSDLRDLVKYYSVTCLNDSFDRLKVPDLRLSIPMKTAVAPRIRS